jgi:hypothetical protein
MKRLTLALALLLLLPGLAMAQGIGGGPGIQLFGPRLGTTSSAPTAADIFLATGKSLILCNTADCVTNYERGGIQWTADALTIFTTQGGTGNAREIRFSNPGYGAVYFEGTAPLPLVDDNASQSLGNYLHRWSAIFASRSIQGSKTKSLTDAAAAASFVRIAVPTNGFAAGRVIYTATSTDGTNILVSQGSCEFAAADTGGTVTAGAPTCDTPSTAYKRANTLVCTISGAVSTTNYDLQATCADNLAGSQTVTLYYRLDITNPVTVTPQ